jgi:protein phosphatase
LNLPLVVKEALSVQSEGFIETIEKTQDLMHNEKGKIGNITILDHLIRLEPLGEALVIGDLHGDLESLNVILQSSHFIEKMHEFPGSTLIFLGDYGDRGEKSPETYYLILKLKLSFPQQVVLLRGNHEAPSDLLGVPHDLPLRLQERFGVNWKEAYTKILDFHSCLYNAVYIEDRYLMLHGGLSPKITNLQEIARAHEGCNDEVLEDILWNDPDERIADVSFSPRGAGKLFGKKVTAEVLKRLKAKILIRGHEASNMGYEINHGGKVLTLFSRKGAPYFNRYGAYLQVSLTEKYEKVQQLVPFIHKF